VPKSKFSKNLAICLHEISDDNYAWSYSLTKLKDLVNQGTDQGLTWAEHSFQDEPRANRIQFDDGLQSSLKAIEWLTNRKIHCTLFICPEILGRDLNSRKIFDVSAVRDLAQNPFVTFGSHTSTHARMTSLKPEQKISEAKLSFEYISNLSVKWSHEFAFPWGDCDSETIKIIEAIGYRFAWTTSPGNINEKTLRRPMLLPRLIVRNDYSPKFILNRFNNFAALLDRTLP
jgi:peptidoglycan/xylan/chitin deacetylase (PgdA/CDA1 family)